MRNRRQKKEAVRVLARRLPPRGRRAYEARISSKARSGAKAFREKLQRMALLDRRNVEAISLHAAELYSSAIDTQRLVERIIRARSRDKILELLISFAWEVRNLSEHSVGLEGLLAKAITRIDTQIGRLGEGKRHAGDLARAKAMGRLIRAKLFPDLITELGSYDARAMRGRRFGA